MDNVNFGCFLHEMVWNTVWIHNFSSTFFIFTSPFDSFYWGRHSHYSKPKFWFVRDLMPCLCHANARLKQIRNRNCNGIGSKVLFPLAVPLLILMGEAKLSDMSQLMSSSNDNHHCYLHCTIKVNARIIRWGNIIRFRTNSMMTQTQDVIRNPLLHLAKANYRRIRNSHTRGKKRIFPKMWNPNSYTIPDSRSSGRTNRRNCV